MLRGWWPWCWAAGLVVGGCLASGRRWLTRTVGGSCGVEEKKKKKALKKKKKALKLCDLFCLVNNEAT